MFSFACTKVRKKEALFSMAIEKLGTHARVLSQLLAHENRKNEILKETDEDDKKKGASMEKRKAGTKEKCPDSLSLPNKNTIIFKLLF